MNKRGPEIDNLSEFLECNQDSLNPRDKVAIKEKYICFFNTRRFCIIIKNVDTTIRANKNVNVSIVNLI